MSVLAPLTTPQNGILKGLKILFAGTSKGLSTQMAAQICEQLGEQLAKEGAHLLVRDSGAANKIVAQAFANALDVQIAGNSRTSKLSNRVDRKWLEERAVKLGRMTIVEAKNGRGQSLPVGTKRRSFRQTYQSAIEGCDVILLIGGIQTVGEVGRLGKELGKLVLPLGADGGIAAHFLGEISQDTKYLQGVGLTQDAVTLLRTHPQIQQESTFVSEVLRLIPAALSHKVVQPLHPKPIHWVGVAGTGLLYVSDSTVWASREVGEALARARIGLVVGGGAGVEHIVTSSYLGELPSSYNSSDWVKQVVLPNMEPDFPGGSIIYAPEDDINSQAIRLCNATILIGGIDGTDELYAEARHQSKPVFPLAGTGGDAQSTYHLIHDEWNNHFEYGDLDKELFSFLSTEIQTSADAESLARFVVSLIEHVLSGSTPKKAPTRNGDVVSDSVHDNREEDSAETERLPPPSPSDFGSRPWVLSASDGKTIVIHSQAPPPPLPSRGSDLLRVTVALETTRLDYGLDLPYICQNELTGATLGRLQADPVDYGLRLFNGIFNRSKVGSGDPGATTWQGYLNARKRSNGHLRIEFFFNTEDLDLQEQKEYLWEYLRESKDSEPLAIQSGLSVYRRLYRERPVPPPVEAKPLKVLFVIANPHDLLEAQRLDGELEKRAIVEALANLHQHKAIDYDILETRATLSNIRNAVEDGGYHVLHIISHGLFDHATAKDTYRLVLENEEGNEYRASATELRDYLPTETLRLLVLTGCNSGDLGDSSALSALAPTLVRESVPAVIAMQRVVLRDTARLFLQYFYDDLARSGDVTQAITTTRRVLYTEEGRLQTEAKKAGRLLPQGEWGIPVLFLGMENGRILRVDTDLTKDLEAPQPLPPVPTSIEQARLTETVQEAGQGLGLQPAQLASLVEALMHKTPSAKRVSEDGVTPPRQGQTNTQAPPASPLAPKQDRQQIAEDISRPLKLEPAKLQKHVVEETNLDLPEEIYRRLCAALNAGHHVILTGPPGTGKSTLAQSTARYAASQNMCTGHTFATATADWSTFETIGGLFPGDNGKLEFKAGVLLQALASGRWLVVDELNRSEIDKSLGELITILAGQSVTLPFSVQGTPVRIFPSNQEVLKDPGTWWNASISATPYDYFVHPNWRMLASMNTFDGVYLNTLSNALARRFAQIHIALPDDARSKTLLDSWLANYGIPQQIQAHLRERLHTMWTSKALRTNRELGPAIFKDLIKYLGQSLPPTIEASDELLPYLDEALALYVGPQMSGLPYENAQKVYDELATLIEAKEVSDRERSLLCARIRSLYNHVEGS